MVAIQDVTLAYEFCAKFLSLTFPTSVVRRLSELGVPYSLDQARDAYFIAAIGEVVLHLEYDVLQHMVLAGPTADVSNVARLMEVKAARIQEQVLVDVRNKSGYEFPSDDALKK